MSTTNATILIKKGSDSQRAKSVLAAGELGTSTDKGRVTIGDGTRPGGSLLPASFYATVGTEVALAQGSYIFNTNGTLLLPNPTRKVNGVYLIYPGEFVKVVTTKAALANGATKVKIDGGATMDTRLNSVTQVSLDVIHEVTFILSKDRRWQLT